MKNSTMAALMAFAVCFAADASAELYKCVKDGKTAYQEQPCGGQGMAETRMQTSKPSGWVGCYRSTAPALGNGAVSNKEMIEIRQEGGKLFSPMGMEGPYERRMLWSTATAKQMRLMRELMAGKDADGIEITSGVVMSGASTGSKVTNVSEEEMAMGFWWIRGIDIEGDPMGHLPRTKETLRTSKETLYFFSTLGAFDKASKVPCAQIEH